MIEEQSTPLPQWPHWEAKLDLVFRGVGSETVLVGRRHHGPLRVQRAFLESSGACHAYVLHPPGGVVGGDRLAVNVQADASARALVTTPGATKFYRSAGAVARQIQHLRVDAASSLEWLPQETIVFDGAIAEMQTTVQLAPGGRAIAWDVVCLGRPAAGERFNAGRFRQRMEWFEGARPLLTEALTIDGSGPVLEAAWGLAGCSTYGTLVVHPVTGTALPSARSAAAELLQNTPEDRFGASQLMQSEQQYTLVCRYLGTSTERCKAVFTSIWQALRPLVVGLRAEPPRVWRT